MLDLRLTLRYIDPERVHVTPDCGFSQTARFIAQQKLANMVGTTREWLNAQLKQLQRGGMVCVKSRKIVITDLARLKEASR